ncbi:hypothetical protein BHM03_00061173 [Ensete ventricosum]|nr:hypothetical protein BHM03_00061173 [Ensete ventricosum]
MRKRLRRATTKQPADASGSTARSSANKGKGNVELGEAPERGYTMRELCEVEDQAGADRYFTSIMTRLKGIEGEDPLGILAGALHPTLTKQVYECSSEELMNTADKSTVWVRTSARPPFSSPLAFFQVVNKELKTSVDHELATVAERRAKEPEAEIEKMRTELESLRSQRREHQQEVGLLRSSLDGAWNDRARLKGDVLSLTKATTLLEVKLKAEGGVRLQGILRI